jgi:hypothetical protein
MNRNTYNRPQAFMTKAENEPSVDFLFVHLCDGMLYYHNIDAFKDVMQLAGKSVESVDIRHMNKLVNMLPHAKNIICYRTYAIPDVIRRTRPDLPIGYAIDDNIFYEGKDGLITESERSIIRQLIIQADYCLAYSPVLASELKKYNPQSFAMGNPPLWQARYIRHNIFEPKPKSTNDIFTIGITTKNNFNRQMLTFIADAVKDLPVQAKVVYFSDSPVINSTHNVSFEYHHPTEYNARDWYNKLHSFNFDLVYIEYPDHILTAGKSDLKFRESAYTKTALLAVDPTQKIYSDIVNGENGYSVSSREEAAELMKKLVLHPELCRQMGEKAYHTLASRSAHDQADKILNIFKSIKKKV